MHGRGSPLLPCAGDIWPHTQTMFKRAALAWNTLFAKSSMSEAAAIKKPMLGLWERLWVRWRSWIFSRRIKTSAEIERAIEQAKKLDPGIYLLFVRKGSIPESVLVRMSTASIRFMIVEVHGLPEENVALYRVGEEKPL